MKKFLLGAFLGMFALAGVALPNFTSAQLDSEEELAALFDEESKVSTHNYLTDQDSAWATWILAVKRAVNLVLALLSTIAVIICLYAGFLMVTSAGDDKKYQKGMTVLKYAAIGLAIIALAWIIVSLVFWFVNTAANNDATWNITTAGTEVWWWQ